MQKMTVERRDNTILNAVLETNKLINEQSIELAKNTTETRLLKESVQTLNGKVAGHETRLQTQEGLNALMAQGLQNLKDKEEKAESETTFWQRNQDKIVWGIIGIGLMLFYYLLTHNGFPRFLEK
jgi:hypothetical protein